MNICVDAGFLIDLYSEDEPRKHKKAECLFYQFFGDTIPNKLLIPWPILYESVDTRMTRKRERIEILKKDWEYLNKHSKLELLDDSFYREKVIDESFKELLRQPHYRSLSLTDRVIRNMLSEKSLRINYFITSNITDFIDVCAKFRIKYIDLKTIK